MRNVRSDQQGFDWAEQLVGGRIIKKERHNRWRPQWFLEIETLDHNVCPVVLRGYRNPGYTAVDEKGARDWLAVETEILRALQDLPVKVPRLYGHNGDLGWMLMERVEGKSEITEILEPNQRFAIYRGYMEELARLHAYPLDKIAFSPLVHRPSSPEKHRQDLIKRHTAAYRAVNRTQPEPIMELGIQWLGDNHITSERPLSLGLGDVGPNQFMFVGSDFRSLIDFEYGMIADPLMEIGMMRTRELQYPIGRLPEHILYYGTQYEALTGIPLDLNALRYWTVAGPVIWNMLTTKGTNNPDPTMIDLVFLYSWEVQTQRGIVEAIAEYYQVRLDPPEIPAGITTMLSPIHETLIGQIEQYFAPRSQDQVDEAFAKYSAALGRTLARGNASAGRLDQANMEELADLLGHRPDDWHTGLYELEQLIAKDYARNFEKRLNFLYRVQMRREHLHAPMQRATGCGSGVPLSRFDDMDGIEPSGMPLPLSRTA